MTAFGAKRTLPQTQPSAMLISLLIRRCFPVIGFCVPCYFKPPLSKKPAIYRANSVCRRVFQRIFAIFPCISRETRGDRSAADWQHHQPLLSNQAVSRPVEVASTIPRFGGPSRRIPRLQPIPWSPEESNTRLCLQALESVSWEGWLSVTGDGFEVRGDGLVRPLARAADADLTTGAADANRSLHAGMH
jgi:hypothetical protein